MSLIRNKIQPLSYIMSLPNDVLLLIFLRLDYVSFVNASKVNKRFKQMTNSNNLAINHYWNDQINVHFPLINHDFQKHLKKNWSSKAFFIEDHRLNYKALDHRKKRILRLAKLGDLDRFNKEITIDDINLIADPSINIVACIAYNKHQHILDDLHNFFLEQYEKGKKLNWSLTYPEILRHLTPLTIAVICNQSDKVETMLNEGKEDVNHARQNSSFHDEWHLINIAARFGYEEILRKLIKKGAWFDKGQTSYFFTPLHEACKFGQLEIVKMLVRGFNLNPEQFYLEKYNNFTPLRYASEFGHAQIVKWLLENTTVLDAEAENGFLDPLSSTHGYNALQCAVLGGNFDIIKLLVNKFHYPDEDINNTIRLTKNPLIRYLLLKMQLLHKRYELESKAQNQITIPSKKKITAFFQPTLSFHDEQQLLTSYRVLIEYLHHRMGVANLSEEYPSLSHNKIFIQLRKLPLTTIWQEIDEKEEKDFFQMKNLFQKQVEENTSGSVEMKAKP